jgi:hypothetical protein
MNLKTTNHILKGQQEFLTGDPFLWLAVLFVTTYHCSEGGKVLEGKLVWGFKMTPSWRRSNADLHIAHCT